MVKPERNVNEIVVLVGVRELPATVERTVAGCDAVLLRVAKHEGEGLPIAPGLPQLKQTVFIAGYPVKYAGTTFPKLLMTSGQMQEVAAATPIPELHTGKVFLVRGASDVGASGGALVNDKGELLGLVFAVRFRDDEGTHAFAIPLADLAPLLNSK